MSCACGWRELVSRNFCGVGALDAVTVWHFDGERVVGWMEDVAGSCGWEEMAGGP